MQVMGKKPKFNIDDTAFVVERAEIVHNNQIVCVPLGVPVKVSAISVLQAKGRAPEVSYEVLVPTNLDGIHVRCWMTEGVLATRILDVA